MVDRTQGRKKSDFVAKSTVDAGSYLDYFVNGTNYKISYDNFVNTLGVTGSITTKGPGTAAPVLTKSGTVNYIRGLEDGPGVVANVSANDGIKIEHSFTADTTGTPLFLSTTSQNPVIASLVAGAGISLTATSNYVTVTAAAQQTYGLVTMHGNTTNTVIAATNTPVLVAGTFVAGTTSSNFTSTTGGRLTYTGASNYTVGVNVSITLRPDSGSNQTLTVHLAKNGTVLTNAKISRVISFGQTGNVSLNFTISLATNDYLELFVSNGTSTDDILVTDVLFGAH
jgi:hypothetical protein